MLTVTKPATSAPSTSPMPHGGGHDLPKPGAGFRLELSQHPTAAQTPGTLKFKIVDASGTPVTDYDVVHEKQLHMFAVRDTGSAFGGRFTDFQHVHPEYIANGEWQLNDFSVPSGSRAGIERIFVDFRTGGTPAVAQAAFGVEGLTEPAVDESRGYTASVVGRMPMGDAIHATVLLKGPDGKPVAAVDPFLGAPAHWAMFEDVFTTDVPMAHAHPMGELKDGTLQFHAKLQQPNARHEGWIQFRPEGEELVTVPLGL